MAKGDIHNYSNWAGVPMEMDCEGAKCSFCKMACGRIDRDQDRLVFAEDQLVELTNEIEFLKSEADHWGDAFCHEWETVVEYEYLSKIPAWKVRNMIKKESKK